ncbi:MAG: hypothetical protein JNL72_03230 [Flavipsychrobacter sp.]|nr:hypothetical protein [Flavipsychrobacter sp.]
MEQIPVTQDDLFDLGFEPMETENTKSMHYEHKELGIRLWRGMFSASPEAKYWKAGFGKDKIIFETLEQLQAYIEEKKNGE